MSRHAGYVLLSAAVLAVYLTMIVWTLPAIEEAAGGQPALDMRPLGYSIDAAQRFVEALSAEGRAIYRGPQRILDVLFPGLLVIWSCWTVAKLFSGRTARVLCVVAGCAALGDYAENVLVARLISDFDAGTADWASRCTLLKSMASTVVYTAILLGVVRLGWRAIRR